MTELTLLYILIALTAVLLIGLIMVIMINRGLNREVNSMVQTLQGAFKVFGDMISQNQRDSAENLDKRLADLNTRFSHMAVENEQKLENIRTSMEKKIPARDSRGICWNVCNSVACQMYVKNLFLDNREQYRAGQ